MSLVAQRYAEALFSLALENNKVETYRDCLDEVAAILSESDVKAFFASLKIANNDKKALLTKAFGQIDKDCLNFLYLLVDKGRFVYYDQIIREYHNLSNNELGYREGIIYSARPLDKEMLKKTEEALSCEEYKVILKEKTDKSLISGFRIVFDDEIIDGSMKEKIRKMNYTLKKKG